jgi:hypothetical protein
MEKGKGKGRCRDGTRVKNGGDESKEKKMGGGPELKKKNTT